MHIRWYIVATAVAAIALGILLSEQSHASARDSARDKVYWDKASNFNSPQPTGHKRKPLSRNKQAPNNAVMSNTAPGKSGNQQPARILGSSGFRDSALRTNSASQAASAPKPAPTRCEWARSIVNGYAFANVEARTCEGSIYSLEATREGKRFSIQISALNGELIKVERIESGIDPGAITGSSNTLKVEQADQ